MKLTMRVAEIFCWSFLLFSGCSELGQIGFPGDYGNQGGSDLVGEVRDVDTRARQIELSTDAGRKFIVRIRQQYQGLLSAAQLRRRQLGTGRLCSRARATRSRWTVFHRSDHGERKRAGTGWPRRNQQAAAATSDASKSSKAESSLLTHAGVHLKFAIGAIGWWLFHCRTTPRAG